MTRTIVLAVLALSTSLAAQQPAGEMISKDLVKLLLGGFGFGAGDAVDIKEGVPDDFPEGLLPDGARALVSVTSARSTIVVAEAPELTAATVPRYERKLAAAGWSRPPLSNRTTARGLVSPSAGTPAFFCSGDRYATYSRSARPGGGSLVRVSVMMTRQDFSPCTDNPLSSRQSSVRLLEEVDMPALIPPAETRASGMGGSAGSDHEEQRMRLATPMTAPELVEHYAAQLVHQGWTEEARAAAEGIVVARFRGKQLAGKDPVIAIITAVAVAPGDVDLALRVMRVVPNPR